MSLESKRNASRQAFLETKNKVIRKPQRTTPRAGNTRGVARDPFSEHLTPKGASTSNTTPQNPFPDLPQPVTKDPFAVNEGSIHTFHTIPEEIPKAPMQEIPCQPPDPRYTEENSFQNKSSNRANQYISPEGSSDLKQTDTLGNPLGLNRDIQMTGNSNPNKNSHTMKNSNPHQGLYPEEGNSNQYSFSETNLYQDGQSKDFFQSKDPPHSKQSSLPTQQSSYYSKPSVPITAQETERQRVLDAAQEHSNAFLLSTGKEQSIAGLHQPSELANSESLPNSMQDSYSVPRKEPSQDQETAMVIQELKESIMQKRTEILYTRRRMIAASTSLQNATVQSELLQQQLASLQQELAALESTEPDPDLLERDQEIELLKRQLKESQEDNRRLKQELSHTLDSFRAFKQQTMQERSKLQTQKANIEKHETPMDDSLQRSLIVKQRLVHDVANARQHLDSLVQILHEKEEHLDTQFRSQQDLVAENTALIETLNLPYYEHFSGPAEPPPEHSRFSPIVEVYPQNSRNLVSDVGSTGSGMAKLQEELKDSQPGPLEFAEHLREENKEDEGTPRRDYNPTGTVTPPMYFNFQAAPVDNQDETDTFREVPSNLFD